MNMTRFVLAVIAVLVVTFISDFVMHGMLLKGMYDQTPQLWRPEEEYKIGFMFLSQALASLVFVFFFTRHYENKGLGEGVRFGLWVGLLFAALTLGQSSYMPISLNLAMAWVVTSIIHFVILGVVTALVYKEF